MATELLGNTQTATYTYMTAPRLNGLTTASFLPSISARSTSSAKPYDTYPHPATMHGPYDTYPHPAPVRRSVTCMPWRSSYFGVSRGDPAVAHMCSMPEQLSERSRTDIDSFKVRRSVERRLSFASGAAAAKSCNEYISLSVCLSVSVQSMLRPVQSL